MLITTKQLKNVRFVYSSSTVTFTPQNKDGSSSSSDSHFQLALQYSLSGGRVLSVVNQAKIKSLYMYIYRSLDRITQLLSSNGVRHVATNYINELSRNISLYTANIMSHDYRTMLESQIMFAEKFVHLAELFGDLKLQLEKDLPGDTLVSRRLETLEKRLLSEDLIPVSVVGQVKELLHGFQMNFLGEFCIHKLCFDNCRIMTNFTFQQFHKHKIQCQITDDRLIRDDIMITKGTVVTADVSTQDSNVFELRFEALFSFFHQNINGSVYVNQTIALFQSPEFEVSNADEGFTFDLCGRAHVSRLSTWESLTVSFYGVNSGKNMYVDLLQNKLARFLTRNVETIRNQTTFYTDLYTKSTKSMKSFEITKTRNYQQLIDQEITMKSYESHFKQSRAQFLNARETFKSYQVTSSLKDFERILDTTVCKLDLCPETCLGTNICQVCQTPETVKADILKCENIKRKVRVTQEEVFDDACNEAIDVFKTLYTGTCNTGSDVTALRTGLPDWGSGIGEMIGGTTGGVIGALTGTVVGQFFQKCTDTWDQYRVREVQRVPCKKSRYYTKEQEWVESMCNKFEKKVISQFGVPTSCNCTSHCVMTQEPSCLESHKTCTKRRTLALKSMLQSAHVFNETALNFVELETKMELWAKKLATAKSEYVESQLRYNQSLNDFNEAVNYAQMIHSSLEKLKSGSGNINVCLKDNWVRAVTQSSQPLTVNSISFGPISFLKKELEINLEISLGNNAQSYPIQGMNTYDLGTSFDSVLSEIATRILCKDLTTVRLNKNKLKRSVKSTRSFSSNLQYTQADVKCNRVLEMFEFVKYPIDSLDKLEKSLRAKRMQTKSEITEAKLKIASFSKAAMVTEASLLDKQATGKRLEVLDQVLERYSAENILRIWRNDMEKFASTTSVLVDRGIIDGLLHVGAELIQLVKLAKADEQKIYVEKLKLIKIGYTLLYFQEGRIQNLQHRVRTQKKLMQEVRLQMNQFCSQDLIVSIDQPHQIDVLQGDNITLNCLVAKNKATLMEKLRFTWYHDNTPLSWQHEPNLVLRPSKSGTYRCMVETASLNNVSSEVYINVESKPVIHGDIPDVPILENEENNEFTMFCNVSGSPEPSIQWRYKLFNHQDNQVFDLLNKERDAVLKVTRKSARSGFYQCVSSNKHGTVESNVVLLNVLKTCVARQAFRLSFTVLRSDVTTILDKIFYSDDAKKAWSVARTQQITLAITHHGYNSKVHFRLLDTVFNDTVDECSLPDRSMVAMVAISKTNMVQLLRNVLKTMSVKTNEKTSLTELREELRSTLLLESSQDEFCPDGFVLHESQFKCGKSISWLLWLKLIYQREGIKSINYELFV